MGFSELILQSAHAQEGGAAPAAPGPGGMFGAFFPFLVIIAVFYLLIFRPQQKQQKARKQMLAQLKRGDEIITNGGIFGKITDLTDQFIMLQVANNVTIKVDRGQISTMQGSQAAPKK